MLKSVAGDLVTTGLSQESVARKGGGRQNRAGELKKACQDFEAILSNQLLKSMRQNCLRAEEPDQAREIFEGMMDEKLSSELSRHNQFGLGNMLYERLLPLVAPASGKSQQLAEGSVPDAETAEISAQADTDNPVALKDGG